MITFIWLALSMSVAQSNAEPRPSQAAGLLRECVRAKALELEPAGEPVSFTVEAAFMGCEEHLAEFELAIMDAQDRSGAFPPAERLDRAKALMAIITSPLRSEVTVRLMELRAEKR